MSDLQKPGAQRGMHAMSILRSIWAVLAGYLALSLLVMILLMIAISIVPQWRETVSGDYLATNLMISILSAALGGWLCARLAPSQPMTHALVLGVLTTLLGVMYALNIPEEAGRPQPPEWYGPALAVIALPAVIGGAVLHARLRQKDSTLS